MIPLLGGNLIPIDDLIIGGKLGGISPQKKWNHLSPHGPWFSE